MLILETRFQIMNRKVHLHINLIKSKLVLPAKLKDPNL